MFGECQREWPDREHGVAIDAGVGGGRPFEGSFNQSPPEEEETKVN